MHTMLKILGAVCSHAEIPASYIRVSVTNNGTQFAEISAKHRKKTISLPNT